MTAPVRVRVQGRALVWTLVREEHGLVELATAGRRLVVPRAWVVRVDDTPRTFTQALVSRAGTAGRRARDRHRAAIMDAARAERELDAEIADLAADIRAGRIDEPTIDEVYSMLETISAGQTDACTIALRAGLDGNVPAVRAWIEAALRSVRSEVP